MQDQLPRLAARGGKSKPHEHVVKPALEHPQQVLACHARLAGGLLVIDPELLLKDAVVAAGLLLLAQLDAVLALLLAAPAVLPRRIRPPLDAALVGQAALAFEEQLLPLAPTLLALWGGVTGHCLDAPPLARTAAIVRLRCDVFDAGDLESGRLKRSDRGLATGARALDEHLDLLEPVFDPLAGRGVGGHLRGERGRLAGAFEAGAAGGLPRDHVPLTVGERDDRVVERG